MEGLTIESLARSVGLTGGAVFRHFPDKQAILLGLIEDIDRSLATIRSRAAAASSDPVDNLRELVREHLSSAERRRGVSFVVIAEVLRSRDPELRTRMNDVMKRHLAEVERLLEDAFRSRLIRRGNAQTQAIALFGLVQGAVTLWKIGSHGARPGALFESLWSQYLNGIRQSIR
ncbi:MAG: TetR family transcriptional regulator [Chloroflexi bacterium]|nr:TetR family transcriptional regulator [Chloroflexota bacterium]